MTVVQSPLVLNDVDRRIWADELDAFVPQRVFDIHTHCYRWDFNTDPAKDASAEAQLLGETFREAGRATGCVRRRLVAGAEGTSACLRLSLLVSVRLRGVELLHGGADARTPTRGP